jgi:hypothetical protein
MNATASLLLLFVAAGLLVLAGGGIGHWRGRPPSKRDAAIMAAMTGGASAFLLTLLLVTPLVVLPAFAIGVLVVNWIHRRAWGQLGAFLVGGGVLVSTMQAFRLLNDALDPAVVSGWSPEPLAIGIAFVILGSSLLIVGARHGEPLS